MLNPPSITLVLHLAQCSLGRYLGACNTVSWWSYMQGTERGSCFVNASMLTAEIWFWRPRGGRPSDTHKQARMQHKSLVCLVFICLSLPFFLSHVHHMQSCQHHTTSWYFDNSFVQWFDTESLLLSDNVDCVVGISLRCVVLGFPGFVFQLFITRHQHSRGHKCSLCLCSTMNRVTKCPTLATDVSAR